MYAYAHVNNLCQHWCRMFVCVCTHFRQQHNLNIDIAHLKYICKVLGLIIIVGCMPIWYIYQLFLLILLMSHSNNFLYLLPLNCMMVTWTHNSFTPLLFIHCTGMFTRKDDGKLHPLKCDHDILNLKENDVVIVEIKD